MNKWHKIRRDFFDWFRHKTVNDGSILPWWGVAIRLIILPLNTLYYLLEKHYKIYDMYNDTYTIEGIHYSGRLFRNLGVKGFSIGTKMEITICDNNIITIKQL